MPTVRELREKKGWSQQELAEKAGLGIATINNLENGRTVPNRATLKLVALALNVNVEKLTEVENVGSEEVQ